VFFWKNCFARFFPPFFGQDIRVNIKNVFSHFLETIFAQHFLTALFVCFWKNGLARFFPFFGHDFRVNIKNVFLLFFGSIFFPTFFAGTIRVFLEKLFRAFFSPIFWSRY